MSNDSDSPLSTRRGGADPTDIGSGLLGLEFSERNYDANSRQSLAAPEPGDPVAPTESYPESLGPPPDRAPIAPSEPGTATFQSDSQQADAAFKHLGK